MKRQRGNPPPARQQKWPIGLALVLLLAALVAAYWPSLPGQFVWDDADWTTKSPVVRGGLAGLWRIWASPTAMQQYYPLTGSSFWLDQKLWDARPLPHHVENVALHALAAWLFWRLLRRLEVPGAAFAAALFALHPVMVESVAWIAERKNVLSLVFFLGAMLAYGRHALFWKEDAPRVRSRHWWWALALFALALLAKVTALALPALVLLVTWWKRGRLRWREDVRPTLPFFALAGAMGLLVNWLEHHHVRAEGPDFNYSFAERCLVAGRAFWFYPAKLLWPANLNAVYPRWEMDPRSPWPWFYPLGAAAAGGAVWLARGRVGRATVCAVLFYTLAIFPTLGFLNLYGLRYSPVANRWVYLPSLGLIAAAAAVLTCAMGQLHLRRLNVVLAMIVIAGLAILTRREAELYRDAKSLWTITLERDPRSWTAHGSLGNLYFDDGRLPEAADHFYKAIDLRPDYYEARNNLGLTCQQLGRTDEAIAHFEKALELRPGLAEVHNNLGNALLDKGRLAEATSMFQEALRLRPEYPEALSNLGYATAQSGNVDEAIRLLEKAIALRPDYADARNNLGNALLLAGRVDEAIASFEKALQSRPDNAEALNNLGSALLKQNRTAEALARLQRALELKPNYLQAQLNLGNALLARNDLDGALFIFQKALKGHPTSAEANNNVGLVLQGKGRPAEAAARFDAALRLQPNMRLAARNLAWLLATSPDSVMRDGARALQLARQAQSLSGADDPVAFDLLAAAFAESGNYPEAVTAAGKAVDLATRQDRASLAETIRRHLESFRANQAWRDTGWLPQ